MLEYWKDGKKVECGAIYDDGYVGQVVILDHVSYGEDPDLGKYPLARYPQPYAFTIVEMVEGIDGYCVVVDAKGSRIKLRDQYYGQYHGASQSYLYDVNEWLAWQRGCVQEKLTRKNHKIEQLEAHVDLLKGILINQGFRVITQEHAKSLGIA